jgi:putative transposase
MAHVKWECKYHIVFIPKYRKKKLYGKIRKRVGEIFQELCRYKGIEILEGHSMPDHVHMCLSFPPKYSIAMTLGYIKGNSAIKIHNPTSCFFIDSGPKTGYFLVLAPVISMGYTA